jgi:hypothetical protein
MPIKYYNISWWWERIGNLLTIYKKKKKNEQIIGSKFSSFGLATNI